MARRISLTPAHLRAFLDVADSGSFRKAAELNFVTQPALSRTIRNVESAINARLFDRDTRNVALTAAGRELLPIARRIVAEFEDSFSDLVQFVEGRSGRVIIGTLPSFGVHYLPAELARFRSDFPDVQFRVVGHTEALLTEAIEKGDVDFALSTAPAEGSRLSFTPLLRDDFVLVCRADDDLARNSELPWSVFQSHPFIALPRSSSIRPLTDAALQRADLQVVPAYECEGELAICGALVREGLGITAVPQMAMCLMGSHDLASVRLREPTVSRVIGIVRHPARSLSLAAQRFHDQLLGTAQSQ